MQPLGGLPSGGAHAEAGLLLAGSPSEALGGHRALPRTLLTLFPAPGLWLA